MSWLHSTPRSISSLRPASASATTSCSPRIEPRRHLALRRQVPEHDRAARAARRELDDVHLLVLRVVIEGEADLLAVELDRPIDVADGQDHDFQGQIHGLILRSIRSWVARPRSAASNRSSRPWSHRVKSCGTSHLAGLRAVTIDTSCNPRRCESASFWAGQGHVVSRSFRAIDGTLRRAGHMAATGPALSHW
jgi:hypothetical protein